MEGFCRNNLMLVFHHQGAVADVLEFFHTGHKEHNKVFWSLVEQQHPNREECDGVADKFSKSV